MKHIEINKAEPLILLKMNDYESNSVVIKTIIHKNTGNMSVMSFDVGEELLEKTTPFDSFAQIIEGRAEIIIEGKSNFLDTGQSIIIPAHKLSKINANERFKMILTVIKSGYE